MPSVLEVPAELRRSLRVDHPVKALLVRPNGQSFCVQLDGEGLGSIKRVLGMENVDHDYGRHLGIYTFYDSKNSGPINVFPSFLMQGAYVGDVLIVGDLLIEVEDSDSQDEKNTDRNPIVRVPGSTPCLV